MNEWEERALGCLTDVGRGIRSETDRPKPRTVRFEDEIVKEPSAEEIARHTQIAENISIEVCHPLSIDGT